MEPYLKQMTFSDNETFGFWVTIYPNRTAIQKFSIDENKQKVLGPLVDIEYPYDGMILKEVVDTILEVRNPGEEH